MTVDELRRVIAAIEVVVRADAPVDAVAVGRHGDEDVRVDITTSRPGWIIGRRGRPPTPCGERIAEHLRVPEVQLDIVETRSDPGEEPPWTAGWRKPRRPGPDAPATSDALRLPMRPEELPALERPGTLPPAEQRRSARRGAA